MKRKLLFLLPAFKFGGTVFSTLNMVSFLNKDYDTAILPMNPYGPVRTEYEKQGIQILDTPLLLKTVSTIKVKDEPLFVKRIILWGSKVIYRILKVLKVVNVDDVYSIVAKKIVKNHRPDIVCSCAEGASTVFASTFNGVKKIAWFRTEYSVWKNQLTDTQHEENLALYPRFDFVIPVSKTTRDDFVKYFPDMADRVIPIHNIQKEQVIIEKSNEIIKDPFSSDFFNIVSVGRIAKQKQFYLIPQIAYQIKVQNGLNIRWYIIGDVGTGDFGEGKRLKSELDKYNNRDYVICLGSRLNPYPYIKSADLLVNTSYYEACPRVVAEAKILHTPVVCADFSSASEFVNNGVDGFIGRIDTIADIITSIVSNKSLYHQIKSECDKYESDNNAIFLKLKELFG